MSQTEQLEQAAARLSSFPEAVRNQLTDGHVKFMSTWDPSTTIQVGDKMPDFSMTDATGKEVASDSLLAKGPLLITFYRGEWCPFCNIAIGFLQQHLPEFQARGVTLVAMSPELPNNNMTTTEKHALQYPVLTDLHNTFARKLGIVYDQSSAKDLHKSLGIDLNEHNGDGTWEVPVPATLLVDKDGIVRNTAIEPDYKLRLDPKQALEWIDALQK
ncbi:peroxiredoxin, thioredoxin-dependent thiol peroxidase [Xylaria longipes]|nr:peroxiredoxin, thioredoxin-dependent thiol peroxidase [Xylaria longipes]